MTTHTTKTTNKIKDITGKQFGRLTAISFFHNDGKRSYWLFKCSCGKYKIIRSDGVRKGLVKSCGCLTEKKQVVCFKCGSKFFAIQSRVKYYKKLYCSSECKKKTWERYISYDGYYILHTPDGPIREHRWVMEQHLKRKLHVDEIVHHINEDKLDNRLENLEITDRWQHARLHSSGRRKTHCKHGHIYTDKNTYIRPDGYRECRICIRRRSKPTFGSVDSAIDDPDDVVE